MEGWRELWWGRELWWSGRRIEDAKIEKQNHSISQQSIRIYKSNKKQKLKKTTKTKKNNKKTKKLKDQTIK